MVLRSLPFAWFEKIALLLLAADLEARGWPVVRLSVVPATLSADGLVGGTDWARAVQAVRARGQAFQTGEGAGRREAYRQTAVADSERPALRRILAAFLRSSVEADTAYRYDGIWHDGGGNVDLAAWRPDESLLVEAKGIVQRAGAVDWRVAERDTEAVVARTVGSAQLPVARRGLLLPDDRAVAPPGRGFVQALLRVWPDDRPEDAHWPIYLVSAEGLIAEWTISSLRGRQT
jgi:hypothetical protein